MNDVVSRDLILKRTAIAAPILAVIIGAVVVWYAQSEAFRESYKEQVVWFDRLLIERKRMIDNNKERIIRLENLHLKGQPHTKIFPRYPRSIWL